MKSIIKILPIICCAITCIADAEVPARPPAYLGTQVQHVLGIQPNGRSYLPQLQTLISAAGKPEMDVAIDALCESLNAGADAGALSSLIASKMTLKNLEVFQRDKEWKYGSMKARSDLVSLLWSRAQIERDQPKAKRYARGALLFGASDDFFFGDNNIRVCLRDFDKFATIAGLSAQQSADLKTLFNSVESRAAAHSRASVMVIDAEAAIIDDKNPSIPSSLIDAEIAALSQQWKASRVGPGDALGKQFGAILTSWFFRNIAHARRDQAALDAVDELLKAWAAEPVTTPVAQWLKEARNTFGDAPSAPRIIGPGAKGK